MKKICKEAASMTERLRAERDDALPKYHGVLQPIEEIFDSGDERTGTLADSLMK